MNQLSGFFGHTLSSVKCGDLYVALNSYGACRDYEDFHAHEHASVSFLLNGGYQEELNGKLFKRNPGDIKFIAAGESHRCNDYHQHTRKINIELPATLLGAAAIKEDGVERILTDHPRTKFTLLKFYGEMQCGSEAYAASFQQLLLELLCPVASGYPRKYKQIPTWAVLLKDLLHARCHEQLGLTDMAAIVGVHPVTISRYFRQYFDTTLGDYLRDIRVGKALSMIKTSDQSLTTIGLACGFSDQSHFTHSFKKVTGFLPKAYRSM